MLRAFGSTITAMFSRRRRAMFSSAGSFLILPGTERKPERATSRVDWTGVEAGR